MQTAGEACSSTACYYGYLLQNREQDKEELSSVNKFIDLINRIFHYIYILNTELSAFRCGSKLSYILYISLAASTNIPLFGWQTKQVEHYSAMFLLFTSTRTTWEEWFMPTLSQFLKRSDVL